MKKNEKNRMKFYDLSLFPIQPKTKTQITAKKRTE